MSYDPLDTLSAPGAATNASNLLNAFEFLRRLIQLRCAEHFRDEVEARQVEPPQLAYYKDGSAFARFIEARQPSFDEYTILLLALVPHAAPPLLERWMREAIPATSDVPSIGGTRDETQCTLLPTAETALFLLAGEDLDRRFEVQRLFTGEHWFARDRVLHLEPAASGNPYWSGRLLLETEYIELFTLGEVSTPRFSGSFPAREITTDLEWKDLVLAVDVREQVEELRRWIDHHPTLYGDWGMRRKLRPGYRVLFFGPPGGGKSLTARLLGKYTGRRVMATDISQIISKYVGETEKNLATLFEKARNRDWILFFDEADALFAKRTGIRDSHDKHSNQEISYLLQAVDDYPGIVILASNFKTNLDEALVRRFNAMIRFPFPSETERTAIWRLILPEGVGFENGIDLPALMGRYELAGGGIVNAVQHACIEAIARGDDVIRFEDAVKAVRREIEKEGKVFHRLS